MPSFIPASANPGVRATAITIAGVYAAIFLVAGSQLPYFPLWLAARGLSVGEIALITSIPLIVRIGVTPIVAFAADRRGDHRQVLIWLAITTLAALCLLALQSTFWPIALAALIFSLAWNSIMPLTETVAMSAVRRSGLDYGRMRLAGSASFILASMIGGVLVARAGTSAAMALMIAGAALTVVAVIALPRPDAGARGRAPPRLADVAGLLTSPLFVAFLVAAGGVQAAHATFYTFGTLHWERLGISTTWGGILWAIGVIAEIVLFAWSGALARKIGAVQLLAIGAGVAIVRWVIMGFDPPLWMLIPLQVLHGATYGASHIGAMHFIASSVPDTQAGSAQALYASVTGGIAMAGAMLIAGHAYAQFAGRAYWPMAGLAAISLAACLILLARWRGGHLVGGTAAAA